LVSPTPSCIGKQGGNMNNTLSILFHIRVDKRDQKGNVPIFCRITAEGKRATFSIQRSVSADIWETGKERVKPTAEEAKSINAYINLIRKRIYDAHYRLLESKNPITAVSLRDAAINHERIKARSLFKLFEDHNKKVKERINKDFAYGTFERYQTCLKHLKDFVKFKYNRNDYSLHEIDYEFITELDHYFRVQRNCNNNTSVKYIKNFKKIVRIALAHGWIKADPFIGFKSKVNKVDRGYLTMAELEVLSRRVFGIQRIQNVCDVFLFQCFTGLAYIDTKFLTKQNLFLDGVGTFWIKTKRVKTGIEANIPLLPQALMILEKYKNLPSVGGCNRLLPVLSNQKMNSYLKEIADLSGIDKRLSCHLARHTFATTVTLNNGVSLEAVSKMLGHTNLMTTKIYARMLDSRVLDEMKKLQGKMQKDSEERE